MCPCEHRMLAVHAVFKAKVRVLYVTVIDHPSIFENLLVLGAKDLKSQLPQVVSRMYRHGCAV